MRWKTTLVALVAAYCMVPGAAEFGENLVHLVVSGHTAHELDDVDHQRQGSEHGCSGSAHLCSCCPASVFVPPDASRPLSTPARETHSVPPRVERITGGHLPGVFRPPIA